LPRPSTADPDSRVGRSDDEIPPAPRRGIRQIASEIATRELTRHGDFLIEIARRGQHDGANGGRSRHAGGRNRAGDDRGDLAGTWPDAIGFHAEGALQVDGREAWVVGLHPPEIPELAADLVDPVRRADLRDDTHGGEPIARVASARLIGGHLADDEHLATVEKGGEGLKGGDIGRAAHGGLRGGDSTKQHENETSRTRPHRQRLDITSFCYNRSSL
jgi:hypothetical protein